jgi:hypothetical protein
MRLLVLLAFASLVGVAVIRSSPPAVPSGALPSASPEFRPKVWDYPGHNFW